MDIEIDHLPDIDDYDYLTKTKMIFIFNCLENGWKIRKKDNCYVFQKIIQVKRNIIRFIFETIYSNKFKKIENFAA